MIIDIYYTHTSFSCLSVITSANTNNTLIINVYLNLKSFNKLQQFVLRI